MRYRVLGPLEVRAGSETLPLGGYRQRLVLALLLSRRGEVVGTDWLVDAVWGEHPPRTARKTLQAYIARLRGVLGEASIEHTGPGYRLVAADDDVDASLFERLVHHAHRLLASRPSDAATELVNALALWRGPAFGEMCDELALQAETHRLAELRLAAIEDRVEAEQKLGHRPGVVAELETLVAEHPTRSRLRAALMLALYRSGRSSDALALFSEARTAAEESLGADPDPALVTLNAQILRTDPALDVEETQTADDSLRQNMRNPYKGLRPFDETDASDFYGRNALIDTVALSLAEQTLVVVVGASGSGKSSLVRAGLVPRLRRDGWTVVTMTPGAHPFENLRQAGSPDADDVDWHSDDLDVLRTLQGVGGDGPALLVVDQCEELLTQTPTAARRRFFANLVAVADDPAGRCAVLATLRADFLDQVLADPTIGEHVSRALVPVGALTPAAVMEVASQPALDVGCAVQPELLAELVVDMADSPGGLPLLEFALTELFDRHDGGAMTLAQYRSMGGLRAAVGRRAERTYSALEATQQDGARRVFLRLVSVTESGAVTRRRQERDAVESVDPDAPVVLDAFDRARLLTLDSDPVTGRATVDIAHESLVSAWPRLATWVQESRDDLRLGRMLSQETDEWEAAERDDGYLIRDARLAAYDTWPSTPAVRPTVGEREFLARSRAERDRQRHARRRSTRRLRGLVAVTTVVALLATGLAGLAINRAAEARAAAHAAQARDLASSSTAVLARDADLAVLLALEAVQVGGGDIPQALSALHAAVSRDRLVLQAEQAGDIALLPDGRALLGGTTPRVIDLATAGTIAELPDVEPVDAVAASADGSMLVTHSESWALDVWAFDGESVTHDARPRSKLLDLADMALHPDGLIAVQADPTAGGLTAMTATGEVVARRVVVPDRFDTLRIAVADDAVLRTQGENVMALDLADNDWQPALTTPDSYATDVAVTPEGGLATTHHDGWLRVWGADGTPVARLQNDSMLTAVAVDDTTGDIVTGDTDGRVSVWRIDGEGLERVQDVGRRSAPIAKVVTRDALVGVVDEAGEATVWGLGPPTELRQWPGGGVVEVSPGGTVMAVAGDGSDGALRLHRVDGTGSAIDVAPPRDAIGVIGLSFTPAGPLYATYRFETLQPGLFHEAFAAIDPATGDVLGRGKEHYWINGDPASWESLLAVAYCVDFSPAAVIDIDRGYGSGSIVQLPPEDGCGLAVDISADGTRYAVTTSRPHAGARVYDMSSGQLVAEVTHSPAGSAAVGFSPDGRRLLTTGRDGTARIWNAATAEPVVVLDAPAGAVFDALWTADGSRVVTSHGDGKARVWDSSTGQLEMEIGEAETWPHIAVTPDGQRLLTSADGVVLEWTLDSEELIGLASQRVTRTLTPAECDRYGIEACPPG